MTRHPLPFLAVLLASLSLTACTANPHPLARKQSKLERGRSEAFGNRWIISTQGKESTLAAREVLSQGGNIIDAAIAASFAISVERPHSTGLGGGGFLIYFEAKTGHTHVADFRERAPRAATRDMYLDAKGDVIEDKSLVGVYAAAVPGLVKGLAEIHAKFGALPFSSTVQPAIRLAEKGFKVYPTLAFALKEEKETLAKFPSTKKIFFKTETSPLQEGDLLVQSDLAQTLKRIALTKGNDIYTGETSKLISITHLGWITGDDLKNYSVKWRQPLKARFKDYDVVAMPPPSSGGAHVLEILNLVENSGLSAKKVLTTEAVHATATAMQLAFYDRSRFMGDPDFVDVPVKRLISKEYAKSLREKIAAASKDHALSDIDVETLSGGKATDPKTESTDTTHFSIMDSEGNAVVSTQTINGYFGSGFVVPATGIVMNNEMDDFSAKPGVANMFGAIGGDANAIAPGKTPLSSMAPTLVFKDGKPLLAIGAPGGTRIINCVVEAILNRLEYELPLYESVSLVRFHHQWKPNELVFEPGLPRATRRGLEKLGYPTREGKVGCIVMATERLPNSLHGVSDPRDAGTAMAD